MRNEPGARMDEPPSHLKKYFTTCASDGKSMWKGIIFLFSSFIHLMDNHVYFIGMLSVYENNIGSLVIFKRNLMLVDISRTRI